MKIETIGWGTEKGHRLERKKVRIKLKKGYKKCECGTVLYGRRRLCDDCKKRKNREYQRKWRQSK